MASLVRKICPYLNACFFLLLTIQTGHAQERLLNEALEYLDQSIPGAMETAGTPGLAVAVVTGDRVVYQKGFGVRRLGESEPVTGSTIFQIGSISKSFTSLLVAQAVDRSLVSWEDRVIEHFPGFRMSSPWVTSEFRLFDLMSQHSGLPSTAGDLLILFDVNREHFIHEYNQIQPVSSFRTEFAYQNGLFLVAAKIVEELWGESWEALLEERIFQPLDMRNTTADFESYMSSSDRAGFHQVIEGQVKALPWDWPYLGYVDLLGPAGGINSSVEDMALYLKSRMARAPSIISKTSKEYLERPQTVMQNGLFYCQALVRTTERPGGSMVWHNGETSGAKNMMAYLPEHDIGIVVLSNLRENRLPEWIAAAFFDVYQGYEPTPYHHMPISRETLEPPTQRQSSRTLGLYAGEFESDFYGAIKVVAGQEGLQLLIGSKTEADLEHHTGDTFWLKLPVIDQPSDGFASFEFGPDGTVQALWLEAFDPGDIGTFRRVKP